MILLNRLKNIYRLFKYESSILSYSLRSTQSYETNITEFINNSSLSSKTKYLIWVDTINFKTNIFKGQQHNWILINSYICTIGKPTSPTIKGIFYAGPKGYSFGEARGFRCLYYTQIKDNYLFHSIPYNLDGSIRDPRLGLQLKIPNGFIIMFHLEVQYIYLNILYDIHQNTSLLKKSTI